MILTVDIGNSRIKWGLWQQGELHIHAAHDYQNDTLAAVLDTAWAELEAPERVILACVAGDAPEQTLQIWLGRHWQLEARVLQTSRHFAGLTHGYLQPEQHGVDRWAAMIAARALYQSPLCVISCGTATTLDLIDARGQHLGGQIMPGTDCMLGALQSRIPALANLAVAWSLAEPPEQRFASTTEAALRLGVMQMAAAGLDRACDDARSLLGAEMQTLITGGAAVTIMPLMNNRAQLQPHLVLQGLYIVAQQERD